MRDPLHAVADAEDRHAHGEDLRITLGGVGVVDGAGAAGEDQARRSIPADFFDGGGAWEDGGEDLLLANAARDELGVLAAKIQDDYAA